MDKNINGNIVSQVLYDTLNTYLQTQQKIPSVVDISIGNDFGGLMYSKMKQKKISSTTPINFQSVHFDSIDCENLLTYINELNNDDNITGIMLQLPLPNYLKNYERLILDTINPNKDVDGLTTLQSGLLFTGQDALVPCTALGIETLLRSYGVLLEGKQIAIINRSNIVGKPLVPLMLRNNATPIVCHSKTNNLSDITKKCDIVIAALNKQQYITNNYIRDNAVVIDVGVHKNSDGKTVGDVNYLDVVDKACLITPPVGAVGPMTICMLAYNATKTLYGADVNHLLDTGITKAKALVKKR